MGQTHTQRLRQVELAQSAGLLAADTAKIVHTFEDGWTIRQLMTFGDLRREGWIMRSCLAKYAGDTPSVDHPGQVITKSDRADDELCSFDLRSADDFAERDLDLSCALSNLYSLRDPNGLPHATWWSRISMYSCDLFGHKNAEKLKADYEAKVTEWMKQAGAHVMHKSLIESLNRSPLTRRTRAAVASAHEAGAHHRSIAWLEKQARILEMLIVVRCDLWARIGRGEDPEAEDLWRRFHEMVMVQLDEIEERSALSVARAHERLERKRGAHLPLAA